MAIITVSDLKRYIYENHKIEYILEQIGCHHIVYHSNKDYFSCANYNGDNITAINISNNEYLNCRNYTRKSKFDEQSDLITLVQYNKNFDFYKAIKYLHKLLGLPLTLKFDEPQKEVKDPLDIFKKVKKRRTKCNVLDYQPLDEELLNDYVPYIHINLFREGVMPWTIKKFGLAYSYRHRRNIIPLRHWLTGELLGFNQRTTVKNYELFDIPKYFITPTYKKQNNIFGLWENRTDIEKSQFVVVYESEKSVLKRHSLGDGTGVALSGHVLSEEQARILIGLNVEIIIAMDKDIDIDEVRFMCEKFYHIRPVSYIIDKYDLLGEKDSPADAKPKIFDYLMKYRIKYDEHEHREYLKSLR